MPFHHLFLLAYQWLVTQNLWKAVVTWIVGIILGATFVQKPWRKHRKVQNTISDQLNTGTPGGLEEVVSAINKLSDDVAALREDKS